MTGQLITFPVRLYARGARLLVHAAEDVTGKAVMSTLRVAGALGNLRPGAGGASVPTPAGASPPPARRPAAPQSTASPARVRGPRPARPAPPKRSRNGAEPPLASERLEREGVVAPIDLDAPTPLPPEHVSPEPVVVREESEPGAQDGAGASITVQEPWQGYGAMNARDIVSRLSALSSAELAAVQLYEGAHRKRQTVLAAAARELGKSGR